MAFVHLHTHSQYSLLHGMCRLKGLLATCKEQNMGAVAVTDAGNLFGSIRFYKDAQGSGVKPILGAEITPGDRQGHILLLAETNEGWDNLRRLNSDMMMEPPPPKGKKAEAPPPKYTLEVVGRRCLGIIALSGGVTGDVYQTLLRYGPDGARTLLQRYVDSFPEFFVELCPAMDRWRELLSLAADVGASVVATGDVYYLKPEEAAAWEVLKGVARRERVRPPEPGSVAPVHHFRTEAEMREFFAECPGAVDNAAVIADRCQVKLTLGKPKLPRYDVEGGDTTAFFLKVAREGLEERFKILPGVDRDLYRRRLEMELEVIVKMDFPGYFLIVWDFIKYAREKGIPVGPGRGSGAGSLVAYALTIADIDPIKYGLMFERFLNPERVTMPDFDIDFCKRRRPEVVAYLKRKYGEHSVGRIATFKPLNGKTVLKDVGKAFGVGFGRLNDLTSNIPQLVDGKAPTIKWILANEPRLQTMMAEDPLIAATVEYSRYLEGLLRETSVHASGIVISEGDLWDTVPSMRDKEGALASQLAMEEVEMAGLIKFDLLGLSTMTQIDLACKLIGPDFDINTIPLDDSTVYDMIAAGDTLGVFQMVKEGFMRLLPKLKPDRFDDVIAAGALYRPGPLKGGMVEDFIERKHGRKKVEYLHPALEEATRETYGVLVYQEQIMATARALAGYTLGGADLLRRAMGKKKKEVMDAEKAKFLDGCRKVGTCADKLAAEIFDLMEKFSGYGFNKSHSTAYGLISYMTAYLKTHHTLEFMASYLSIQADEQNKSKKIAAGVWELKRRGFKILPPDVNRSVRDFNPEDGAIRFGFSGIKEFGDAAMGDLLRERVHGPFKSFYDLCRRVPTLGKRPMEALIHAGAVDTILPVATGGLAARESALATFEAIQKHVKSVTQKAAPTAQISLFDMLSPADRPKEPPPPAFVQANVDMISRLAEERRILGFYLSSHPLHAQKAIIEAQGAYSMKRALGLEHRSRCKVAAMINRVFERKTKKDEWMAILFLEDPWSRQEAVCFPQAYAKSADRIESLIGKPAIIHGTVDIQGSVRKIIVDQVFPIDGKEPVMVNRGAPLNDFTVFDLETTNVVARGGGRDVDASNERIVEIGVASFAKRKPARAFSRLINPEVPIARESQAVHGINDDMVKGELPLAQRADGIARFFGEQFLMVYNGLSFDVPVFNAEMERAGHVYRIDPAKVIDVYRFVRARYNVPKRPASKQLRDQCAFFGIKLTNAHRASADAEATGLLFMALQERGFIPQGLDSIFEMQESLKPARDR